LIELVHKFNSTALPYRHVANEKAAMQLSAQNKKRCITKAFKSKPTFKTALITGSKSRYITYSITRLSFCLK